MFNVEHSSRTTTKRWWLAVFALAIGLTLTLAPGTASADPVELFEENFDEYVVDSHPGSFSGLSTLTNYEAGVIDRGSGDHAFRVARTATAATSSYVTHVFPTATAVGDFTVRVDAKAGQTDAIGFIAQLRGETNLVSSLAFYNDGKIRLFTSAGWQQVGTYTADTWYRFQLDIDAASSTIDVTIDDVPAAQDLPFRTAQEELRQWQVGLYQGTGDAALEVDELSVVDRGAAEPAPALAEDFELQTIGAYPSSFSTSTPGAGYSAEVAGGDPEQGRYLHIARDGASTSAYLAGANLSAPAETAVLAFRAKAGQADAIAYAAEVRGPAGTVARVAFYNDGSLRVYDGSWVKVVDRYSPDRWYDFRVLLDATAQEFSVAVDGRVVAERIAFQSAQTAVSRVSFGLFQGYRSIDLMIDDVEVTVPDPAPLTAVSLPATTISVARGHEASVPVTLEPATTALVVYEWSTADSAIATVSDGVIAGISAGTTTVQVEATDLLTSAVVSTSQTVQVVEQPVAGVDVQPANLVLPVDSTHLLDATVQPADASEQAVTWSTSDPSVASVNAEGQVTAVAPGLVTIEAAAGGGTFTDSVAIEVVDREVTTRFYVDPAAGDDADDGGIATPFRTIERAQAAVRQATDDGTDLTGDVEVVLADGVYELDETLRFDARDGGDGKFRVTYRSANGANPVLSGGRVIDDWQTYDAGRDIYRAPAVGVESRQLYVDGIRAIRARSEGPLTDASLTSEGVRSADVGMASWSNLGDVEFVFRERWTQPRATVGNAQVAPDASSVEFVMDDPGWTAITSKGSTSVTEGPVYVENALELLDDEGEWYADGEYVYYKPRVFEDLAQAEVVVPVLEQLVEVTTASLDDSVRGLAFEGVEFAYSTWMHPSTGWGLPDTQSNHLRYPGEDDWLIGAAVTVEHATDISFRGSTFSHLGGAGLQLLDGVQDSAVSGNRFFDISGTAVNAGRVTMRNPEIYAPTDERSVMARLAIESNYIHDIGIEYASSAGIAAGFLVDSDVSKNEIFNVPYSGISIGYGVYNFVSTGQRDVRVEANYIHDIMGHGVNDGGAIYTVGYTGASQAEMNSVNRNYLQNQRDKWGVMYADNASNHWAFTENVVDQVDTPIWEDFPAYWAFGKEADLLFDGNYTTTPHVNTSFTSAFPVLNTHVVPDADWPTEALQIINESGVLPADRTEFALAVERLAVQSELALESDETVQLAMSGTRNKGDAASLSGVDVYYRSLDEAVATVSGTGEVEAIARGATTIETRVVQGELLWTFMTQVYVDDVVTSIEFSNVLASGRNMIVGESLALDYFGRSDLDREVELTDVVIVSSDPAVVEVQVDGTLAALAEGEAELTLTSPGAGVSTSLDIAVVTRSSDDGLAVTPYDFGAALADTTGWSASASTGSVTFPSGSVRLATPSGHATYTGQQFSDELLTFDLTIEGESGWEAIEFRNQDASTALRDTYAVVIKPNEIELHRFNDGERTVIFGAVTGFTSVGGPAYPNDVIPFGTTKQVQIGAINEPGGVRIVLNVDGENVFYYLDSSEDRITDPGYLSMMARFWSVLLSPATLPPADPAPAVASSLVEGAVVKGKIDVTMIVESASPQAYDAQLYIGDGSQVPSIKGYQWAPTTDRLTISAADFGALPDGPYYMLFSARNVDGQTATLKVNVRVDNSRPDLVVSAPAKPGDGIRVGATDNAGLRRVAVNLYDASNSTLIAAVGSTPATTSIDAPSFETTWPVPPGLAAGTYTLRASAVDIAGNSKTVTVALVID
ncbi:MAG TPA: Ig-like domain-containing protein [Microbacterium sp.]|uniref:Ig-like domain-containing protein n=1 Tax=Microbacterium sp. TaxID=51671 RepID=UPI002F9315CD